jgi:hypothetical protein
MADGTDEQVRAAWQVLANHRETSYARFDTTKIYMVQASGSSVSTLLFLPVSSTSNSQSALGFANFGTLDASPVIVESDAQSITYKDYTSDRQVQVVNGASGVVATTTSISNPSATINQRAVGVGSAQCIQNAYTNNGWISTWAFIQTLAIPQTGIAIAADCIFHSVFNF